MGRVGGRVSGVRNVMGVYWSKNESVMGSEWLGYWRMVGVRDIGRRVVGVCWGVVAGLQ